MLPLFLSVIAWMWLMTKEVSNMPVPAIPETVPEIQVIYQIVSWHLSKIGMATHKGEAVFHWRQVKYYRDYWHNSINPPEMEWQTEKEMIDLLRSSGECANLIAAIDHHQLLEIE